MRRGQEGWVAVVWWCILVTVVDQMGDGCEECDGKVAQRRKIRRRQRKVLIRAIVRERAAIEA
jgi:hypothetical protein